MKEWGQWACHKPEDCKKQSNKTSKDDAQQKQTNSLQSNANLAAFDTIVSDTE